MLAVVIGIGTELETQTIAVFLSVQPLDDVTADILGVTCLTQTK